MTTMTRQHFNFIADTIKDLPHGERGRGIVVDDQQHAQIAAHFADALKRTNPGFKSECFLRACGVEPEPEPYVSRTERD